ncbi:MAG: redoxin domain-containing protein, partial [Akkermansiaceae bacterium]|nr:redoxin domain-containing protein [Akkermansiaceae bacterium]
MRDADAKLKAEQVTVLGVSTDSVPKQKRFCNRYQLPFDLLSDQDAAVCRAFGVPLGADGRAARETFMMRNGRIFWHDPKVDPAAQAYDA